MPCICCYNVKNAKSKELPYAAPGQFVTHTELDVSKLRFHIDESVFILADRLQGQQPTQGVTQFKDTQKRVGLTLSSCALLWDLPMRNIFKPISCTMYDWMHCYMIDGVCSVEIGSLMASLKPHGITYEDIHVFLQHWHWPSRFGTSTASGKQRCGADHAKKWYKEAKFKPSASEMLSLYAVFAFFFTHVCRVPPACAAGVTCFLLLCDVVDTLQRVSRDEVSPDTLMTRILRHLQAHKALYGDANMTAKFHWVLHIAWQMGRHGILLACFMHERKHRMLKRYSHDICNTSRNFEKGLLSEITDHHLSVLEDSDFALINELLRIQVKPRKELISTLQAAFGADCAFTIGHGARFDKGHEVAHRGDVVMLILDGRPVVGRINVFCVVDVQLFVCIDLYSFIDKTKGASRWRTAGAEPAFVDAEQLLEAVTWSQQDDIMTVIVPPWRPS